MSKKRQPLSRGEIFFVVATTLATALFSALLMAWYTNREDRWIRVASPPAGTPVQIFAVDRLLNVYVGTADGYLYRCGSSWREGCREVLARDMPVTRAPAQWLTCASPPSDIPEAPGPVVDSLLVGRCLEAATYSQHIITQDGSIWQWRRTFSGADRFATAVCLTLGIGLGAAGGYLLVWLRRWIRHT